MLVKIRNPIEECHEISGVSNEANAGDSALTVLNNEGLIKDDYIVARKIGDEQAELRQIDSVSGSGTINLTSTTSFSHPIGAIVFKIDYNQVEISSKASESGAFSVLATIDLEVDDEFTIYDDTSGQTTGFYRTRLKNEQTGQFSDYSAILAGTGFSTRAVKPMIDSVLERTNDQTAEFTTRRMVLKDLNYAYQKTVNKLIQASHEFGLKTVEIPTESFKHRYTLPDAFREIQTVRNGDGDVVPPTPRDDRSVVGYELVGRSILYIEDVPTPAANQTVPTVVLINDAFDTDGTWVVSDDAVNISTDLDEFKVGTGSINFDVDVSNSVENKATVSIPDMTAQDLSDFEDSGKWRTWIFLPDVTYISSIDMKWGSSSTVYWTLNVIKDYKNTALKDGWNLMEFNWADQNVSEVGSPATSDAEAIDYLSYSINYTANQPDDTDFRLDAIQIADTWAHNSVYEIDYLSQPAQLTNEMDEMDLPEGYQELLLDYPVGHILMRQPDNFTKGQSILRSFDKKLSDFILQSAKRTRRVRGIKPPNKRTYRIAHSDSSRIVHSDGGITPLR